MNTNYPGLAESQGQPGDQMLPDHQDKHFLSPPGLGWTGHSASLLQTIWSPSGRGSLSLKHIQTISSPLLSSPEIMRV